MFRRLGKEMRAYLGIVDGRILITDLDNVVEDRTARTVKELVEALAPYLDNEVSCEFGFQFSSSMDFPEEETDDPVVLETIEWIMEG